jgi:type IV pilus assembly protein PilY1
MWAFDISDASVANWEVAKSHDNSGTTVYDPLFTACTADPCTTSNRQAITSKPQVVKASSGGVLVLFGTGKYFEIGDNTDVSQTQSFYSILDDGSSTAVSGRSVLQVQTIMDELLTAETGFDSNVRVTSDNEVDLSSDMGWYLDLFYDENSDSVNDHPGERVVADPLVRNGRVIFATLIPETSPCSFGGTSYLMEIDAESGSRLDVSPFDLNGDGVIDQNDWVEIEVTDSDGNTTTIKVPVSGKQSNVGIIKTPGVISTGGNELKYTSGSSGDIEVTTESSGDKLGLQ